MSSGTVSPESVREATLHQAIDERPDVCAILHLIQSGKDPSRKCRAAVRGCLSQPHRYLISNSYGNPLHSLPPG